VSIASHTTLIERVTELDVLGRAVAALGDGTGGVVVLEATAGLGKTALLEHAGRLASEAGCLVCNAAPSPHERDFPFGVVRTLLEAPLRAVPATERATLLTGAATPAGALLLDGEIPGSDSATAVAHGVMWMCAGLARAQPLVLIIDNAQWSDRFSLQVVSYLAGRIDDVPLLILVAARLGDPRAANDVLALIGGVRSSTILRPQPLTPMGAVRLIRGAAPDASIHACCECHRGTAGNPWLLGELSRHIQIHGPVAIERIDPIPPRLTPEGTAVVRRRLAELEPRDRAVAAARAVIGDDAPPHAIAHVAGATLAELGPAHDALAAAGLLRPDGEGIPHELIATAIRDDLSSAHRERLHRESARALIELGATSEVVARHLLECRPRGDMEIGEWLERAGADAVQRGAPTTAATYLERALEERTPAADLGRLSANLAAAEFDAGKTDPRARLRAALGETRDGARRLDLLTRLAAHDVIFGGDTGDTRLFTRELSDPRTGPDARLGLQVALLDALLALPERHGERARRAAAIEAGAMSDPVLRRVVLAHRAWLATELGSADAQTCAAMALEALDGGYLLREARSRAAYHLCVAVLVATDQARPARRAIAALRDEALARGSTPLRAAAGTYAAQLSLRSRGRGRGRRARRARARRRQCERVVGERRQGAGGGPRRARRVRRGSQAPAHPPR
jgi:AAA ATPase domain